MAAAKYTVTQRSYIGGQLLEPGAEVEFDGKPGLALEPLNAAAKKAKKAYAKERGLPYDADDGDEPDTVTVLKQGDSANGGETPAARTTNETAGKANALKQDDAPAGDLPVGPAEKPKKA